MGPHHASALSSGGPQDRAGLAPSPDGSSSRGSQADLATHRPHPHPPVGTDLVPALPGCVTLGKVLKLSEPCLLSIKRGQGCHLPCRVAMEVKCDHSDKGLSHRKH